MKYVEKTSNLYHPIKNYIQSNMSYNIVYILTVKFVPLKLNTGLIKYHTVTT